MKARDLKRDQRNVRVWPAKDESSSAKDITCMLANNIRSVSIKLRSTIRVRFRQSEHVVCCIGMNALYSERPDSALFA